MNGRYWDPFLQAIEESEQGREITEAMATFEMNAAQAEVDKKVSAPVEAVDEDDEVVVAIVMHPAFAQQIFDSWIHYLDHDCAPSAALLDDLMGMIVDKICNQLFHEDDEL